MRNDECTIYNRTSTGKTWTFRRDSGSRADGKDWTQTVPSGRVFRMTAEQVLSHLLPPLAGKSRARLSVVADVDADKGKGKRKDRGGKGGKAKAR
jgi:hypothetical protein